MKQEDLIEIIEQERKHLQNLIKKPVEKAPKPRPYPENHLDFDTSTYFDKIRDVSNLHERYLKDIEAVRERISSWGGHQKPLQHETHKLSQDFKDFQVMKAKLDMKHAQGEPHQGPRESKGRKVVLKTRTLMANSGARSRKNRIVTPRPVTNFTERYFILSIFGERPNI